MTVVGCYVSCHERLHLVREGVGEPSEQLRERIEIRVVPVLQEGCRATPCGPCSRVRASACPAGVSWICVARLSSGSAWRPTSPSRSSCWIFRVTVGASTPSRSASAVTLIESLHMELVEEVRAGPVEADPGGLEQPFVQLDLGNRPGDGLQPGLNPFDRAITVGAGRRLVLESSCFRHITIIDDPPNAVHGHRRWFSIPSATCT